ncbi:MAG: hypothetical protein GY765_38980, partial [bacterium]|nr:hypothetical protein [bacterium]
MNRRYITMCLVLALCSVFCLQAGQYTFSGLLPGVEREPGAVVIRIDAPMHHKQLYIHYKTRGLERSQVRMMKKGKDGHFRYRLPTANLYGDRVEYYIAQSEEPAADVLVPVFTVTGITGKETPEVYFLDAGPGAKPGTKGKSKFKFPIDVSPSLSAKLRIHDKDGQKGKGFDADGN